jgi:hypothetical protein
LWTVRFDRWKRFRDEGGDRRSHGHVGAAENLLAKATLTVDQDQRRRSLHRVSPHRQRNAASLIWLIDDPIAISAPKERRPGTAVAASHSGSPAATNLSEDAMATVESPPGESTIYGSEAVLVEQLLPAARARLVTIADDATLLEAAGCFEPASISSSSAGRRAPWRASSRRPMSLAGSANAGKVPARPQLHW